MKKRDFPSFLLYALAFFLLWEWLRPVEQLTDTGNIGTFIIFLLLSLLVSFLNLKRFWRYGIQVVYILFSIHRFFYHVSFFDFSWLQSFSTDIIDNVVYLFTRNWNSFTDEFRTLSFFIVLWIMVYLIQYWLLRRQRIFIFFFMTLIYITVLDTFTPYSAKAAIVRTVIAGFMVMGMLTFYRMTKKANVGRESFLMQKWMIPLVMMVAVSVFIGITAPKAAPVWPDPIPFFKAEGSKALGEGNGIPVKRIGYGTDDTQLGGPFIGDDNPVYYYQGIDKHYWKVETKDFYTGKGWIPSGSTTLEFRQGDLVPVYPIPASVKTFVETALVNPVNQKSAPVIYPAGVQKIHDIQPKLPVNYPFLINTATEKFNSFSNTSYMIDFKVPEYQASELRKTTTFDADVMDPIFYKKYTQLPDKLPARIKQLTEKITAGQNNWFDKASAVERYFGNNQYIYDQRNVAVPSQKQDYVDQFLFETKRGYCDNFSSSMVVMLRSIGIPARWVKGYTGGEFLELNQQDSSKKIYKITNNNAHSWVEVFFPNEGWVPFEPTQGFTNDTMINYGSAMQTQENNQSTNQVLQAKKPQKVPLDNNGAVKTPTNTQKTTPLGQTVKAYAASHWKRFIYYLVLLSCVAAVLYWIRGRWFPYWIVLVFRFRKKDESVADAYLILLKQFSRFGIKRKENQTLRSFAQYIDSFFSTREMSRLTTVYEQYLYHRSLPKGTWKEMRELWENLIKRTTA